MLESFLCCKYNQVSSEESIMSNEEYEHIHRAEAQMEELFSKLQTLASPELYQCVKKVEKDYLQNMPHNVANLCDLINVLNKDLKPSEPKSKGIPNPFRSSKLKVYPVVASKTFGADKEILKKAKVDVCSNPEDCELVVLFCPVISRVASDVNHAMTKIPDAVKQKPVVLVVMHHTRKDIDSTQTQLDHSHQNVVMNVQVLFHETLNGLLKCDRNEWALQGLQEMCKNFAENRDSLKNFCSS